MLTSSSLGVPQGSSISSLLCCLHLAHLEIHQLWPRIRFWSTCTSNHHQRHHDSSVDPSNEHVKHTLAKGGKCDTVSSTSYRDCNHQTTVGVAAAAARAGMTGPTKKRTRADPTEVVHGGVEVRTRMHSSTLHSHIDAISSSSSSGETKCPKKRRHHKLISDSTQPLSLTPTASLSLPLPSISSMMNGVSPKGSLLMRQVDDFLLLTDNMEIAKGFVRAVYDGFPDYGVTFNHDKTKTNFNITTLPLPPLSSLPSTTTTPLPPSLTTSLSSTTATISASLLINGGNDVISWNGLLINTKSLEVGVDYSRNYNAG
jgi:hypothetical protein